MIIGVERLFAAITGPEWQMVDERTGEMVRYNFDRPRKLTYEGWDAGEGGVYATMKMFFLDDCRWREVICLRHFDFDNPADEKVVVTVMAFDEHLGPMTVRYSEGETNIVSGKKWGDTTDSRIFEDRQELLFPYNEVPERIDLALTANLFVDQLIRGEMVRPVLVPEGYFQYEEPGEVTYGAVVYSPNVTRAERLLAEAKNAEELRVAKVINRWVMDQEMARVAMDLD